MRYNGEAPLYGHSRATGGYPVAKRGMAACLRQTNGSKCGRAAMYDGKFKIDLHQNEGLVCLRNLVIVKKVSLRL